ncbi:hypothetical protein [Bifidobacterium panos]|uniref:Tail fiber protein n=1 Tax=Bifidobacterium panos TaxID=2675321 RepID=A0ABX1SY82_9BIFI|nr:hypothetical protein [Bifidobacterium sp. DSM 109963]NMN02793.1 hypothetical protein [Bifidobacterium sp. DSM 109963]
MATHGEINPSTADLILGTATTALDTARGLQTRRTGSAWYDNADGGLVIGGDATYGIDKVDANGTHSPFVEVSQADLDNSAANILAQAKADTAAQITLVNNNLTQTNQTIIDNKDAQDAINRQQAETNKQVEANKTALAQADKDLADAKKQVEANKTALAQADKDLADAKKQVEANTEKVAGVQEQTDKAYEAANMAQKTADGRNRIFRQPDEPDHEGLAVGDLWYRTAPYWTRWADGPHTSASLLADFYTKWVGKPYKSASELVPVSSRVVQVLMWDGTRFNEFNLVAGNIIASGTITGGLIAAQSIVAGNLAAGCVNADKLLAGSVTSDKIVANAIVADKLAAKSVNADKIAANAVTSDKIVANAITADKLAAKSVNADKIAANAITADKINATALYGKTIQGGVFRTSNGRLVVNDTGIALYGSDGKATMTALTSDGSLTLKGPVMSGGTISGTTVTGGTIQTSSTASRGVKITSGGVVAYGSDGKANTTIEASTGTLRTTGSVLSNGTLSAMNITGGTITGATVQTTSSQKSGIKMNSSAFTAYNKSGSTTFRIDATTGAVSMMGDLTSGSTVKGAAIESTGIIQSNKSSAGYAGMYVVSGGNWTNGWRNINNYLVNCSHTRDIMAAARGGMLCFRGRVALDNQDNLGDQRIIDGTKWYSDGASGGLETGNTFISTVNDDRDWPVAAKFTDTNTVGYVIAYVEANSRDVKIYNPQRKKNIMWVDLNALMIPME